MRLRYSLATILFATALIGIGLAGYRFFFLPTPYGLPTLHGSGVFLYDVFGTNYVAEVTEDALASSPEWKINRANPPLAPRDAMIAANKSRLRMIAEKKLRDDSLDDGKWKIVAIELIPGGGDRWFWLVRFEYIKFQSGPANVFLLPVLMDGTVLEPEISD